MALAALGQAAIDRTGTRACHTSQPVTGTSTAKTMVSTIVCMPFFSATVSPPPR